MTYLKDAIDFNKINKVLIIKLRNLGDVVLSTACLSVLKNRFPHLQIDYLINEEAEELLSFHPLIHQLHLYKRKKAKKNLFSKIKQEVALFLKIRSQNYDLVLNLTEGDKGNFLALGSKALFKVGQAGSKGANFLSHLYKAQAPFRHQVEKDLDALRRLGVYPEYSEKILTLSRLKQAQEDTIRWLIDQQVQDFIVIHPVSRWMYKSPQASFFIHLIEQLDCQVIITGHDQGLEGDYIQTILENSKNAKYFPTQGSLQKLISIIDLSKGIVTVDSLPLHLASCLKKASVCLFGPTSELNWGPWQNPSAKVIHNESPCRACYKDGCGGGKLADCLETIHQTKVIKACQDVFQEVLLLR